MSAATPAWWPSAARWWSRCGTPGGKPSSPRGRSRWPTAAARRRCWRGWSRAGYRADPPTSTAPCDPPTPAETGPPAVAGGPVPCLWRLDRLVHQSGPPALPARRSATGAVGLDGVGDRQHRLLRGALPAGGQVTVRLG